MFKVFFKKFYGPKYQMLFIGFITIVFMYLLTLKTGQILNFDTFILSNTMLTTIIIYQSLTSKDNSESFKRLFTYPLKSNEFKFKYIFSVIVYCFTTRSLVLYFIYAKTIIIKEFLFFLINTIAISLLVIAIFILKSQKNKNVKILLFLEIFFYLMCSEHTILLVSYIFNFIISLAIIKKSSVNNFLYIQKQDVKTVKNINANFFTYIKRYFLFNKSYILSFISMLLLALTFTYINPDIKQVYIPYILVALIYNTPLTIVISINKSLQKKIKSYPNQINKVFMPYFLFVFIIDIIITSIFLIVSNFYTIKLFIIQLIFCLQNALLVTFFEYKIPILNWNTETELWNNPRKYIISTILLIESSLLTFFV